jgi:hypothetical protein
MLAHLQPIIATPRNGPPLPPPIFIGSAIFPVKSLSFDFHSAVSSYQNKLC